MRARRTTVLAALALPLALALSGLPTASVDGGARRQRPGRARPRGGSSRPPSRASCWSTRTASTRTPSSRPAGPSIADLHPKTGTFIWSSRSGGATTWHITNLFGADLGDFNVPAGASTPAIDEGGYNAYWVRPFRGGDEAAIMRLEINDPQATPQAVLRPRTGRGRAAHGLARLPEDRGGRRRPGPPAVGQRQHRGDGPAAGRHDAPARVASCGRPTPAGSRSSPVSRASPSARSTSPPRTATTPPPSCRGTVGPVRLGARRQRPAGWQRRAARTWSVSTRRPARPRRTYSIDRTSGIFWSGLKKGKVATDRIKPYVKHLPARLRRAARRAACQRYRHTAKAWREVGGHVTDQGKSLVRYVIIAVFQKRGSSWWGLVGNGKRPTWRKFPTRDEARYGAKERHAKIIGNRWEASIPLLTAGQLVVVAKAGTVRATTVRRPSRRPRLSPSRRHLVASGPAPAFGRIPPRGCPGRQSGVPTCVTCGARGRAPLLGRGTA